METWFSKAWSWFEKLFGKASSWDKAALTAITIVAPLVEGVLTISDPALEAVVAPIISTVQTDLTTATTLISAAQATPTLTGVLTDVQTNMASILDLAEVKNSTSATQITTDVNSVISEIKAILANLPATPTTSSTSTTAASTEAATA